MVDNTQNAASAAEAPRELKSTDTSTVKPVLEAVKVADIPADPPKDEKPDVAAAVAEDAEEAGDDTSDEEANAPPADAAKPKRKRLSRWMRERVEEARLQAVQETEQRLLQQFQQQAPVKQEAPALKTLEDFDYDQSAHTAYLVQEGIKQDRLQREREAAQRDQQKADEAFKARIDDFEAQAGAGAWEDILTSPVHTDPAFLPLVELFRGDEHELAIAHHLATHLSEAKRINALPPIQKAREITKLAERFEGTESTETPKPLPKKTTNAPPPPKTISGSGRASVDINSPELSTQDRIRLWRTKTG